MLYEFPFFDVNNDLLHDFFLNPQCHKIVNDRLSDQGIKEYLFNLYKQDHFRTIDSKYFSCEHFNKKFNCFKNETVLSIFHLNIQSLNSKSRSFVTFLNLFDIKFDVIFLSEIWATNIDFYTNLLDGYSFHSELPSNSTVGGIGMFIKNSISCKPRPDLHVTLPSGYLCENIWFEILKNKSKYIIGGIYRHPNQNVKEFSDQLENSLSILSRGKIPAFLAGDFNIDLLKIDSNKATSEFLQNLITNNFLPQILLPTRITDYSATVIDHIYYFAGRNVNKNVKLYSGNLYSDISDHLPNFVLLKENHSVPDINNRPYIRLHTLKNETRFQYELSCINWTDLLYNISDVNVCYNIFISRLKEVYDNNFPLVRQSRRAFKNKKWVTNGIKQSSLHKFKLYKISVETQNPIDKLNYMSYKKLYNKVLEKAEQLYYSCQFDTKIYNIKTIWSNLNRLCNAKKGKSDSKTTNKLIVDGDSITNPVDICNAFNEYFCTVGEKLVKQLPIGSSNFSNFLSPPVRNSIFVDSISHFELINVINSLKNQKSCGIDGFNSQLIKKNKFLLCDPLLYIYNLSLRYGVVPSKMKIAKVIPIFKKGNEHILGNYRPISLLSVFNKILEKLVCKRLLSFVEKNDILYKNQFGFRKNHSTNLALIEVIDACYSNLDKKNKVLGIFFDLQKAFDSVSHDILLHKLYHYGIRGQMFLWIKSYLENRQQFTYHNGVLSKVGQVNFGVPQGSILGPLLFILYVNDLNNVVENDQLKLFADDTNLFIYDQCIKTLEVRANKYLKNMENWFISNKVNLNVDKTCYMMFSANKLKPVNDLLNLYINGKAISKVNNCKYLGIFIDDRLNWGAHIEYVHKKIIKFTCLFYKVRKMLPFHCLTKMYYSFVHPHILYGVEVYANASNASLNMLNKLNNKILRILLNKNVRTHVKELYAHVNSLPVPSLHQMQLLLFIHKCVHHRSLLPKVFSNYITENKDVHYYDTRNTYDLRMTCARGNFGARCTTFRGVQFWNLLPLHIKQTSSLYLFKKEIKTLILYSN